MKAMIADRYEGRPRNGRGQIEDTSMEVSFDPPEGLELKGDSGEAMVKWRKNPEGKVCITSFNGVSLDEKETPEEDMAPEEESDEEMA